MRNCSLLVAFLTSLPQLLGAAGEENSFAGMLEEIDRLNELDPSLAADRAEAIGGASKTEAIRPDPIRLKALLAPAESLEKGYEAVRNELESLLRKARSFKDEPALVPRVIFAQGDLAYRYGDFEYGLSRLKAGLSELSEEGEIFWRQKLELKTAEIFLAGGHAERALAMLAELLPELEEDDLELTFQGCLLKASAERRLGSLKASRVSLDQASAEFSPETALPDLGAYWIETIWYALESGLIEKARRFLDEAVQVGNRSGSLRLQAESRFLMATLGVIGEERGELMGVRESLQLARQTYRAAAWPVRYPENLERALALPALTGDQRARLPFLNESSSFMKQRVNLPARSAGLAARAELAFLTGKNGGEEVIVASFQESRQVREAYLRRVGEQLAQWDGLEASARMSPESSGSVFFQRDRFYELLILLVFIGIVLVLWNRIRGQRHLNEQLEDSVERARISEQTAEESNRMKSEFLANVSHEMKTPLGGIVGMASLLEELVTDPRQRQHLATIQTCSENLLVLMNDLLDLGRMESGVVEIDSHPMEVRRAVGFSIEMVRQGAEEKGLALDWELDPAVPETVHGDSTRISQVLANLLSNAIKFTEEGSVDLRVTFHRTLGSSGNLVFAISDTGSGIPADKLKKVFEPFHRGPQVTGTDPGGNGLGLAICRKLVDLMGGTVSAQSKEGAGSVFTVLLPVRISSAIGRFGA